MKSPYLRSCKGKRAYRRHDDAKRAARNVRRFEHDEIEPYKCHYCRHWHNGHEPEPVGLRRRDEPRPRWRDLVEVA